MDRHPPQAITTEGTGAFGVIGRTVVRWPWLVLAVWIVVTAGLTQLFPSLTVLAQKAPASILPPDAPSMVSAQQAAEAFKEAGSDNILLVVLTNEKGFTKANETVYRNLVAALGNDTEDVAAIQDFITTPPLREVLVSKDRKAWLLPVNIVGEAATPKATEATNRVIAKVREISKDSGVEVYTTGPAGMFSDIQEIGETDQVRIETATVVTLFAILLMIYRNVVTMLMPLITITVSLVAAQGVVSGLGTAGLNVSNQTIVLLTAMMAGAGTDYAVFLISRYHDYLRQGVDSDGAVQGALDSVGKVITASAATVAVTFLGMLFTQLSVFSTVGVALATAIAVGCLGAVTFLPALLVLAGRRGWAKPRKDLTSRLWRRSGIRIVRRPIPHLAVSLVILIALGSLASLVTFNYDDRKALPTDTPSIRGYSAIERHFPLNASLPQYVLIHSPHDLRTPKALADMEQLAYRVSQLPGIDIVRGITRPTGESLEQARLSFQAGAVGKPLDQAADAIIGNDASLNMLALGADQIADVLGALRGQLGGVLGTAGALVQVLNQLQGQTGANTPLQELDGADKLLGSIHGLGGSVGAGVGDAIATVDQDLDPVLNALNTSPVCDADPACTAARKDLQQVADTRHDGTMDKVAELGRELQAVQGNQTLGATTNTLGGSLNAVTKALQAAGINNPATLQAQLTQLELGFNTLALGSRKVADGVELLVDQTKRLGAGLEQASAFLLSMKREATTPAMAGFYIPAQILTGEEFRKAAGIFISPDGHTARYLVQTKDGPFTVGAMDQVDEVLAIAHAAQPNTTLADATVSMTGFSVTLRDIRDYYRHDLRVIVLTTIAVVLGILMVLLRAVVAPLYLIVSVVMSYLSALGTGVFLFQVILGQQLHWSVLGMTFIILVAVGADYNLLLISRIRDESPHGIRSGVIRTVGQTGGVITAAGLIFAASMIGLQFSSISTLIQMGFIIATGILLDTFLVRTITVPAVAVLVGKANWWPSKWEAAAPTKPAQH